MDPPGHSAQRKTVAPVLLPGASVLYRDPALTFDALVPFGNIRLKTERRVAGLRAELLRR
jgi:hypothetical protein